MIAHATALALFLSVPSLPLADGPDTQPLTLPALIAYANPRTALTPEPAPGPPTAADTTDIKFKAVQIGPDRSDRYILTQTLTPSPDSGSVTYRHRFGNDLALDGIALNGKNFITVEHCTDPVFSPDNQTLAIVLKQKGWKLYYQRELIDGHEPVTPVKFSPDGRRLIYLARDEKKRFVVEGDQTHPHADAVDWDRLTFTNDSTVLAYPAFIDGAWRMVINGDPGPAWDRIATAPIITNNAPNIFYVAFKQGRYHVVDRHTPGPGLRLIDSPPVVSDDGKIFAYWAMGDDLLWRVYRNHKPVHDYDTDRPGRLLLSSDGKSLAAVLKRGDHWLVVHNKQPGPAFAAIGRGSLTISPDGSRLAYAVRKQLGWAIVLDDRVQQTFTQLAANSLRFSPDSKRFAYAALNQGQWSVIESQPDGTPAAKPLAASRSSDSQRPDNTDQHPGFNQLDTATLAFSPDSQHLAYIARNGGWPSVILDGEVLGQYDHAEQLTFSPTSEHLVYIATQNDASRLYVDGIPTDETFKKLVPGARIHFTNDTICQTVVIRRPGPTLWHLELDLTPQLPADHNGTPAPAAPEPTLPDPSFVGVPTK